MPAGKAFTVIGKTFVDGSIWYRIPGSLHRWVKGADVAVTGYDSIPVVSARY
ncbi:MAG: hypothetical protein ACFN0Y_00025 [Lactobacillus sp.]